MAKCAEGAYFGEQIRRSQIRRARKRPRVLRGEMEIIVCSFLGRDMRVLIGELCGIGAIKVRQVIIF